MGWTVGRKVEAVSPLLLVMTTGAILYPFPGTKVGANDPIILHLAQYSKLLRNIQEKEKGAFCTAMRDSLGRSICDKPCSSLLCMGTTFHCVLLEGGYSIEAFTK